VLTPSRSQSVAYLHYATLFCLYDRLEVSSTQLDSGILLIFTISASVECNSTLKIRNDKRKISK